jgi:hypothetical protein
MVSNPVRPSTSPTLRAVSASLAGGEFLRNSAGRLDDVSPHREVAGSRREASERES